MNKREIGEAFASGAPVTSIGKHSSTPFSGSIVAIESLQKTAQLDGGGWWAWADLSLVDAPLFPERAVVEAAEKAFRAVVEANCPLVQLTGSNWGGQPEASLSYLLGRASRYKGSRPAAMLVAFDGDGIIVDCAEYEDPDDAFEIVEK